MNPSISLDNLDKLQRSLAAAPARTQEVLLGAMTSVTQLLEREVADAMPAVSGLTRASISSDAFSTPAGVLGVVGSPSVAALAVELGTKPHMPPVSPILDWVHQKLGLAGPEAKSAAFAIARKIARVGTSAQRPFEKTLKAQSGQIVRTFETAIQGLFEEVFGKGATS